MSAMFTDDDCFRLFGTREPAADSREIQAGPLFATLEDGNLRTIRFMGHEVLRAVAFLVRDKDWGTCAPVISDMAVSEDASGFDVRYTARFSAPSGAILSCRATISGTSDGVLTFHAAFETDKDFETARAGFTVLHPLDGVVGQRVRLLHGDGSTENAVWPERIEPWQPFKDIRAITHGVAQGLEAETRFNGDIFEMEDQRNWTDGSFKTYVRPLALPWPYLVPAGETIEQSVTVKIERTAETVARVDEDRPVSLTLRPTEALLPQMGLGLRPECLAEELEALAYLGPLDIGHLIAHFDPLAGHGLATLEGYAEIAHRSGLPVTLELALPCKASPLEELKAIAALCAEAGFSPASLFVSPAVDRRSTPPGSQWPECPPLEEVYAAARAAFPASLLGGGMMSYFTELNRKPVPAENLDYVSHCTNPIVHAADDLSVMQSFEALRDVVHSVRAIYPDKTYRIGPSTIAMRQNPYGSATKDNPRLGRIPMANVDPRHNAQFGAAFAAAYAATTAAARVDVLTLATLAGPFGLLAGPGEPQPEGKPRPLTDVIGWLGQMAGKQHVAVESSRSDRVLGLAASDRLLLVNIAPEAVEVRLPAGYAPAGADKTISLAPYDVVLLEATDHA